MKDDREIMKDEIKLRMENDSWNFTTAYKVLEIRNSKKERSMNIWSRASLATAAMAFVIFMSAVYTISIKNSSYSGTGSIYSYAYIKDDHNLDNDMIAARLELTINEAYPMR